MSVSHNKIPKARQCYNICTFRILFSIIISIKELSLFVLQMSASYRYLGEGLFNISFKEKALIQYMEENTELVNVKIFGTFTTDIKGCRYILLV
jgi:hypothetical protein